MRYFYTYVRQSFSKQLQTHLISPSQSNVHQTIEVCQVLLCQRYVLTADCHGAHQFVGKQTTTFKFIVNRQ